MKIWLDDKRPAPSGWIWIKSPVEATIMLGNLKAAPIEMSFDHDLGFLIGEQEITGYGVLCAVEIAASNDLWSMVPEKMSVHSANSGARRKMEQAIESIERMRDAS